MRTTIAPDTYVATRRGCPWGIDSKKVPTVGEGKKVIFSYIIFGDNNKEAKPSRVISK